MLSGWWFYWPGDADEAHQAELEAWREASRVGDDYPIPLRDLNRVVFLESNMPPELRGCSVQQLTDAGVRQIPGKAAGEYIVFHHENEHDVELDGRQQVQLLRDHLKAIGVTSPGDSA